MKAAELRERARRRDAELQRMTRDPRYRRAVGRFVLDGLLVPNHEVVPFEGPLQIDDVLWSGRVEPRLLELLPALLLKRPSMFVQPVPLPDDLARVLRALRSQRTPPAFRGIPGSDLERWVPRIGRKGKLPSRLKSFRFTAEDQRLLRSLAKNLEVSETEIIRRALRALV